MTDATHKPQELDDVALNEVAAGDKATLKAVTDLTSYRGGGGGAIGPFAERTFQPVKAEPGEELEPYTGGTVLN